MRTRRDENWKIEKWFLCVCQLGGSVIVFKIYLDSVFGRIEHFTLFCHCLFTNGNMLLNAIVIKVSTTNVTCYAIRWWCTGHWTLFQHATFEEETKNLLNYKLRFAMLDILKLTADLTGLLITTVGLVDGTDADGLMFRAYTQMQ